MHHATANCLLLRIYKKASDMESVTYAEALDEALCFGWIDGQKLPLDEKSWVQRFTPRKPRSGWSRKNTEHVERLILGNQMTIAVFEEVEAAKADGRWAAAYDSPANATLPAEFMEELARRPEAKRFFATINKANLYAIAYRFADGKAPGDKGEKDEGDHRDACAGGDLPLTAKRCCVSTTEDAAGLERDGLAARRVFAEVAPRVGHEATALGLEMLEHVEPLWSWVARQSHVVGVFNNLSCKS